MGPEVQTAALTEMISMVLMGPIRPLSTGRQKSRVTLIDMFRTVPRVTGNSSHPRQEKVLMRRLLSVQTLVQARRAAPSPQ